MAAKVAGAWCLYRQIRYKTEAYRCCVVLGGKAPRKKLLPIILSYRCARVRTLDGPATERAGRLEAMPVQIKKLSDRFADYDLTIKCKKCGHVRVTDPHALAKILGWEATLETVGARLRCSRSHCRGQCELHAQPTRKPRGAMPS